MDTQLEIQAVCGVSGQIFSFQDIGEEKRRADYNGGVCGTDAGAEKTNVV